MRLGACGLVIVALCGACSSGFSRVEAVEAFQEAHLDASTVEAACVVDALIENYEVEPVDEEALDGLEAQLLADPQSRQFELDQFRAMFGCGMTGNVESQLERELVANDIESEAAPCVAEKLASLLTDEDLDVLISDEMTDSFYATFFSAVEACDALPS